MGEEKRVRHILSLSGGKDSAALAIYMRDRVPEMEYIFSDTGKELPETYEYLDRISSYLGKQVQRLNADIGFDHWYQMYGGMIPSNHRRWCTKDLKLKPFERHCGNDEVINYVGLRADENRSGYISHKPNIKAVYPFRDDGLVLRDIEEILRRSGVGMPPYTKWGRTRSGCYFCFYQQKIEWVRLKERYPDLFEKAKAYEKPYEKTGSFFTWSRGESLIGDSVDGMANTPFYDESIYPRSFAARQYLLVLSLRWRIKDDSNWLSAETEKDNFYSALISYSEQLRNAAPLVILSDEFKKWAASKITESLNGQAVPKKLDNSLATLKNSPQFTLKKKETFKDDGFVLKFVEFGTAETPPESSAWIDITLSP